jgi:hypothetical protein
VDETYIKIKKVWMYLYRAVDSDGQTLEFLPRPTRDAQAAKRFFLKALYSTAGSTPHTHLVEEQVASPIVTANPITAVPRVRGAGQKRGVPQSVWTACLS